MGSEFGESDSEEYRSMLRRAAGFLEYVDFALNLCSDIGAAEEKLREFMPDPIKSRQQLTSFCSSSKNSSTREPRSTKDLLSKFRDVEAVEKEASAKYPALHAFLAQRHVICRRFLMTPLLAAVSKKSWKCHKGYREWQSWVFLEYSSPKVQAWIARRLPRSCASRSTAEVARLIDDVERMVEALGFQTAASCSMKDVESSGIFHEEWLSDDPLALAAFELIKSLEAKKLRRAFKIRNPLCEAREFDEVVYIDDDEDGGKTERSLKPFTALKRGHSLRYASIRVIGLKLLNKYIAAGYDQPQIHLQPEIQPFERRAQLELMYEMLGGSLVLMGVGGFEEDVDGNHIEDLLEDASQLLESGQVCSCCLEGFKAIVECCRVYSLPLAKARLPQLARDVVRSWEKPGGAKLWIDTPHPPFPAPVLDELERIPVPRAQRLLSVEYYVGQYRKAKAYGLARKLEEYKDDPLMKTSVELLDKAEAELGIHSKAKKQEKLVSSVSLVKALRKKFKRAPFHGLKSLIKSRAS